VLLAALVGKAGVCRAIGRTFLGSRLENSRLGAFAAFALGAVILGVAYMVPVLGLVMWAITTVLALGSGAVAFRRRLRFEQRARRAAARPDTAVPAPGFGEAQAPATAYASWEGERATAVPPLESVPPAAAPGDQDDQVLPAGAPAYGSPGADRPASAAVPPVPPPPPSTAGAGPYPLATFLDRVGAFVLDALLVALAVQLLELSRYDGAFPLLLIAYHVAFWTWKGTTLGGVVVGLRVTKTQGQGLRFADALVRALSGVFSIGAFGIGCFWMLQDPARQMWHDKIAGTQVLKVPREVVLQEG
jgi:uncharacterized RDD family membrane protein YckC